MLLPLVQLDNVNVIAGGRTLLSKIDLTVRPGEALRLSGPNGGGKTTLLRLLAGEIAPVSGTRVYRLGGELQRSAVQARRRLSLVGPDAEAFYLTREWVQTVRDVLLAGFAGETLNLWEATPAALARLDEVVALTGISGFLERDFRMLSHGQRRRVILARALMPAPELLLLDEFTDGLSVQARAELGPVLRQIGQAGTAIVLATHRPEEAPDLDWRTVYVQGGQIVGEIAAQLQQGALPLPAAPATGDLIRLREAEVYRNGHRALGPLTWTWEGGQHWLVTGENGSGKSTLARLIAGEFHPALGGRVERPYLERDLLGERRRSVGLVGAELGIRQRTSRSGHPWLGRDVVASAFTGSEGFTGELSPEQWAQVEQIAERLSVTDLLGREAATLSQGQLRRLLLARAVVHRPRLLLLDEGVDFLDTASRARFLELLPGLARAGTHIMVIAHREGDALAGMTHHLHLDAGRIESVTALG
ncbi:ATP-binding cassette domain-containing protein [Deinococcus sp.]|uniref:ATP-binding cassette domain-containing protein n=1 Tax=Deinococcus sp. TaxID=47478 RepID=UPI0025C413A0|nr:ATP-binding cassette domain-containing protein [Deinococcus sp.]